MTHNEFSTPDSVNERVFKAVSALLVGLMMACVVLTLLALTSQSFGGWKPLYLPVLAFLFSLERFYLHPNYKRPQQLDRQRLLSWGAYWVAILILIKVVVMLSHGWQGMISEIPLWQEAFLDSFFTLEYQSVLVICLLIWVISGGFAELFWEMRLEQARITRDYGLISSDQERTPRERLQSLVFTVGAVLIVLTALSRMDIRAILTAQPGNHITALPWLAGGGLSTLLYFMLGFALLSLTKFLSLHTRWRLQGIPVSQKMAGRWALYSLIFLTFLAVMVSLLPTHFSMGLISFLHEPLAMILSFIAFIASALLALLLAPFLFLASLLGGVSSDNLPKPEPAGGAPAVSDPLFTLSLPGWELIKPYLFWGLFLIVVIYAMRYYLLQHEELLHRLLNSPVSCWLQQLKQWISHLFRSVNHQIAALTVAGIERLRSAGLGPLISRQRDFLSLRRLSSRQQVCFYYYALIRRGEEGNIPRGASETPEEYAGKFKQYLPDTATEVDIITNLFIEARYTQNDISRKDVNHVQEQWDRIRKILRQRRASDDE